MIKFTYLLIDMFTIIVPFIFSFHPRLNFYKTWQAFFPAVIISGAVFLIWDMLFTSQKVWGFNPHYLTGYYLGNLPAEEVLFFICIPYACVFTYYSLSILLKKELFNKGNAILTVFFIGISLLAAILYRQRLYTFYTFSVLALLLFTAQFIIKVNWLPKFYITYSLLLIPFVLVNGILTGTGLHSPVVWYNNRENLGFRILTIPLEDIFYGMDLILLNVLLYTGFSSKKFSPINSIKKFINNTPLY